MAKKETKAIKKSLVDKNALKLLVEAIKKSQKEKNSKSEERKNGNGKKEDEKTNLEKVLESSTEQFPITPLRNADISLPTTNASQLEQNLPETAETGERKTKEVAEIKPSDIYKEVRVNYETQQESLSSIPRKFSESEIVRVAPRLISQSSIQSRNLSQSSSMDIALARRASMVSNEELASSGAGFSGDTMGETKKYEIQRQKTNMEMPWQNQNEKLKKYKP
jgi:hypothetical protein